MENSAPATITIGEVSYDDQGRSRVMGKNREHVRIYAENERGTLLGAEMLGPSVEHTAHLLAWAVQQRLTVDGVPTAQPVRIVASVAACHQVTGWFGYGFQCSPSGPAKVLAVLPSAPLTPKYSVA